MLRLDVWIILADRHALGIGQRLLESGREFVKAHCSSLGFRYCRLDWAVTNQFQRFGFGRIEPSGRSTLPADRKSGRFS
jgi:hypothetical protein